MRLKVAVLKAKHTVGAEPMKSTPAEFNAFLKNEIAKWAKVIRTANVRAN